MRLSPPDLTALRFATARLVLLPIVLQRGFVIDRLGWSDFAAVVLGGGAPVALIIGAALQFAPVLHAGALYQGTVPLAVACLAAIVFERAHRANPQGWPRSCSMRRLDDRWAGPVSSFDGRQSIGHLLFLLASFMTACYTVSIQRRLIDGLHAAAIAAVVSLLLYLPVYLVFFKYELFRVPVSDLVFQALYQGVLTAAISLALYGRAIHLLGASNAAAFVALGPIIAALVAIPVYSASGLHV